MYLKRVELNGFKSFAEPVSVEFNRGITCIVGPNGSGKSNIADAIRWVLGEQSAKTLRGLKMEDVIFSGTQNRKPKGMCEVSIVIDNEDGILPIDFSEVVITRRMYRSGENEYSINGNICRLKDIRELIMDTGIGVEGYSIIGQGKISDIVSNRMDSRREIFEEAAGIVKYRSKRAETNRRLESSRNNLQRINDIVLEIEGRLPRLEKESERAREYLDLREKYRDVEVNIILRNLRTASQKAEAEEEEANRLYEEISALSEGRRESEKALAEAQENLVAMEERCDKIRAEIISASENLHALQGREELYKERIETSERERARLNLEIKNLEDSIEAERSALIASEDSLKEAFAESELAASRLKEAAAELERATGDLLSEETALEEGRSAIFELASEINSKRAEAESLIGLRKALEKRRELLSSRSEEEEGDDELAGELSALRAEQEDRITERRRLEEAASERTKALGELSKRNVELSSEILQIKEDIGKLAARKKVLEELDSAYEGYFGSVKFLMKKNMSGIRGTVGDLISAPKGYETAIETALGATLQNIVCDDETCAKKAIGLLKENRAGRATFLPVSDMRPRPPLPSDIFKGKEGYIGIASRMIDFSPDLEQVAEYLLGRVAVAKDLDSAVGLSRLPEAAGLRFVTVEGEVVSSSGSITGGSLKNQTGNILSRKNLIEEIASDIRLGEERLSSVSGISDDISEKISKKKSELDDISGEISRFRIEEAQAEASIKQMDLRVKDSDESARRRRQEIEDLSQQIEKTGEGEKDFRIEIADMEERKLSLEEGLEKAVEKLSELKKQVEALREKETAYRLASGSAIMNAKNAQDAKDRLSASLSALTSRLEESVRGISDADAGGDAATREAEEAKLKISELIEEKEHIEKILAEELTARNAAMQESKSLEDDRRDLDSRIHALEMKKYDADSKVARETGRMDSLKERLWDEFEISYMEALEKADPDFAYSAGLRESSAIRSRLRELGEVSISSIDEYKEVSERYKFLTMQRDDVVKAMSELEHIIIDIDKTIKVKFKESFDAVMLNFEEVFKELFQGGSARLSLEDPSDPLESGIEIEAQPPGKKLQNINLLSGGEKAMTAIALMFAVLRTKPTPFCVLDEVEAALDESNIGNFAGYLRNFRDTQFALITHQKATMEYADVLYGVTMPERGISSLISLRLGDDFEV